jgi:cellulose synthase/poly-beta-1,6-N-acetylglucosamine synthase-like glycosyltransferase
MTLSAGIGLALLVLAGLAALPTVVLFVQLLAAALRTESPEPALDREPRSQSVAVLMPAHNEAAGIAVAIQAVRAQLGPRDRLLVVADNCSDETAAVARAAGAEVTERTNAQRRGKSYALEHGVGWLAQEPPAVVLIIDADCIVAPRAVELLARRCLASSRPVQALYLMHAPPQAGPGQRIAEFAWVVRNKLRPLGADALGWPCQLMGSGMAFPWDLIRTAPLASGHLVEDMQLGLDLARRGAPPLFCPQAQVSSVFPSDAEGVRSQRTRWEHGHLSVLAALGPRVLVSALARRDPRLAAMALDLMVPPLAALVLVLGVLVVAGAAWWAFGNDPWPFAVSAAAVVLLKIGLALAWWREGRQLVSSRELFSLPWYVASKVPVYVRLFTKRQVEWVRTKR